MVSAIRKGVYHKLPSPRPPHHSPQEHHVFNVGRALLKQSQRKGKLLATLMSALVGLIHHDLMENNSKIQVIMDIYFIKHFVIYKNVSFIYFIKPHVIIIPILHVREMEVQ